MIKGVDLTKLFFLLFLKAVSSFLSRSASVKFSYASELVAFNIA